MAKLKTKPDLRFAEFDGEWEREELGGLAEFSKGRGFSKGELIESGVPIILYGRLYTQYETEISEVDTFVLNKENSVLSKGNEVIIPASGETAEDISRAAAVKKAGIILGGDLNIVKPKASIDSAFLAITISNGSPQKELSRRAQGKSVVHIHNSDLQTITFAFPKLGEQCKISSFFRNIDTLITLHQRKYDKTISIKKAMLEKMFPREGESKPEIRFAGFSEDWEQRRLGDVADIVRGASPRPIKDTKWFDDKSDIGWLRILDVTEQGGRIYHLEQRLSKMGQERTRVLTEPHLLLSIAATVGKPVINYVKTGVHDGFLIFQDPLFDREFMFQWLEMFRPKWQKYGQPGSQVNLNSDLVKGKDIRLPHEEEQKKIGQFFSTLDTFIALHQRELTKVKNIKKALLEKMFV